MKKHHWQPADWGYLVLVTLPPLILAGIFVAAGIDWQIESRQLNDSIKALSADHHSTAGDAFPQRYDNMTSREQTPNWVRILSATKAIQLKYGGPFAWQDESEVYDQLVPPEDDWPAAEVMARYGKDARPILAELEKLLASDDTIWLPIVFESFNTLLPGIQDMRDVARLLRYTFLDAIHRGDHERALMNVRLMQRLYGESYEPIVLVDELVRMACYAAIAHEVRNSLAFPIWSENELSELKSMLARSVDWDQRWEKTLRSESFMWLPWIDDSHWQTFINMTPSPMSNAFWSFAPSTRRTLVDTQLHFMTLRGVGSQSHVDRVTQASERWQASETTWSLDQQLESPVMNGKTLMNMVLPSYQGFAGAIAREANNRRFTRTALALRMFEHRFGRWPERLEELEQVGVSQSEITAYDGGSFAYEEGPEERVTLYNQAYKDIRYVNLGNQEVEFIELRPSAP